MMVAPISKDVIEDLYFNASLDELQKMAFEVSEKVHGPYVLLRGLIEYSNFCSQDCLYCGIRKSNSFVTRYRLSAKQAIDIALEGFSKGLRTFVLQGGEDPLFRTEELLEVVSAIKKETKDECAITLSSGILARQALEDLRDAGADRYLLRFETSNPSLHQYLRNGISFDRRIQMLRNLRELGFQVGSGFMVGLPEEDDRTRIENVFLCQDLDLDMIGIGPFIPHGQTPLKDAKCLGLDLVLRCVALLRLALPKAHLPATTAAGSIDPLGREKMIKFGANVLMPNLTPTEVKPNYLLYPGKICLDETGFQCVGCMDARVRSVKREISFDRGDALRVKRDDLLEGSSL